MAELLKKKNNIEFSYADANLKPLDSIIVVIMKGFTIEPND
jgi:hypothetical protein